MGRPKGSAAPNRSSLVGQKFGRLTVVADAGRTGNQQISWHCICECGGETTTTSTRLRSGHTKSCGCEMRRRATEANTRHGLFIGGDHELKNVYQNMKARCFNRRCGSFSRYGGRGITICDRWLYGEDGKTGFQCFVEDMGERPEGKTLDRRDNDGNYEPGNCRWATPVEQANNTRNVLRRRVA